MVAVKLGPSNKSLRNVYRTEVRGIERESSIYTVGPVLKAYDDERYNSDSVSEGERVNLNAVKGVTKRVKGRSILLTQHLLARILGVSVGRGTLECE
ncbi:hypothetical protein M378DRAFT_1067849 [Amanita muscaria Koide BX008]|uniref:Uncharacterized protein n=1 Tax=Amanita muscaria (strain Koide BX008) TaxID=946122 RepID=A0A0C2WTA2_AMAMK|nr:hypothetical protein M378DRAFT_1067849 [Amanita muscaria Koide BX008]